MNSRSVSCKITSEDDLDLIEEAFKRFIPHLNHEAASNMLMAIREIVENVCLYAYDFPEQFVLWFSITLDEFSLKMEICDRGLPFDMSRFQSEKLLGSHQHAKGLFRVYDLVDQFYITNHPKGGKCFTLISEALSNCPLSYRLESAKTESLKAAPRIRLFQSHDAEGIAKLIYRNYDYSYYKALYYIPSKIIEANEKQEIISIVAEYNDEIVGHFAMVPSHYSDIAEIGAAAVDPRYKKLGIMNQMFDVLLQKAKSISLSAIYGEGMMMHPYSQKANLRHGMMESAILLGEVPSTIEIEHTIKNSKRTGVVIAYLNFRKDLRSLWLPSRYKSMICQTYQNGNIPYKEEKPIQQVEHLPVRQIKTLLNTTILIFDSHVDENTLNHILADVLASHVDMIFADINLSRIEQIDTLVSFLNQRLFVYAGVMFRMYNGQDYLRLQRKNTSEVEVRDLICYSPYASDLLAYIQNDFQ